jgi:hypothetical protein
VLMDTLVHIDHEAVEMDAPFAFFAQSLIEHVHNHGFPAPDIANDIEPARRFAGAFAEQPSQRGFFGGQPVVLDGVEQRIELFDEFDLRVIGCDTPLFHAQAVCIKECAGHFGLSKSGA